MLPAISTTLTRLSLVALGFLGGSILAGVVVAQPNPAPGPPLPVKEQNLDANGWIKVHEQGTATVNGTVSVGNFPSSIEISNFPETQNVNVTGGQVDTIVPPVTVGLSETVCAEPHQTATVSLATMAVTDLTVSNKIKNEVAVYFHSPITITGNGGTIGQTVFEHQDHDGEVAALHHTFTRAVPIHEFVLHCTNESDTCCVTVDLVGTPGS